MLTVQRTLLLCLWAFLGTELARGDDVVTSSDPTPSEAFPHKAELDERGNYFLFWKYDEETITFEVHAKTHGWVGFGLSDNGAMRGADIVVGWIKDGEAHFQDRHGIGDELPPVDEEQNYKLLASTETGEFTMFKFSRDIETCDVNDYQIHDGTIRVIFAWNDEKPPGSEVPAYHGATQRGTKSLLLLEHKLTEEGRPAQEVLSSFEMTVKNVALPPKRTYYHCRLMALPNVTEKHHIVKVKPIVTKGNEGILHHIIAYFCFGEMKAEEYGRECWEGRMPDNASDCSTVAYGWAVGGEEQIFPNEAGLSIGAKGDPRFFHLEMHYDNPQLLTGVVDNSGFEFLYTAQLRPHDIGALVFGHAIWWPPMIIPPKADNFRQDAYCGSTCTSQIPEDGINFFSAFPHTHLVGAQIWTKHIRNGKELPELYRDDHYDFNYQQVRVLKEHRKVLPGDEFITSCVYNTTGRTKPTYGGPGSDDEMCFNFFFYYPKISLQSCISQTQGFYPAHQLVMQRAMEGKIHVDPNDDDKDTIDYLEHLDWDANDVRHLQNDIDHVIGYRQYCTQEDKGEGVFGGGKSSYEKVVKIKEPHVKESKCTKEIKDSSGTRDMHNDVTMSVMFVAMTAIFVINLRTN